MSAGLLLGAKPCTPGVGSAPFGVVAGRREPVAGRKDRVAEHRHRRVAAGLVDSVDSVGHVVGQQVRVVGELAGGAHEAVEGRPLQQATQRRLAGPRQGLGVVGEYVRRRELAEGDVLDSRASRYPVEAAVTRRAGVDPDRQPAAGLRNHVAQPGPGLDFRAVGHRDQLVFALSAVEDGVGREGGPECERAGDAEPRAERERRGGVDGGSPSHGRLDGIAARPRIEYVSFGELSTADVLADDTEALSRAGESALSHLLEWPTLDRFMSAAREFADDANLLTDDVADAIDAVDEAGGDAAMAMLGDTVFAVGDGLSAAGYDPERCRTDAGGARLRPEE